jgi:exosome complex component RRP42
MRDLRKRTLSDILRIKQVSKFIRENKRMDGRKLDEYRDIEIKTGVVKKAYGSAYVSLGDTIVIAGIHFETGTPFSDTPDQGILITEGEFLPTASFYAEPGPPTEEEIELSRVVDRGIRESEMIDLSKLVITPGEKVLKLFIDFNILNDDGNLVDAAMLAAVSALLTTKYPNPEKVAELENDRAELKDVERIPLPIRDIPMTVTIGIINNRYIVDPTLPEEIAADALLSVTHTKNDEICAMQLLRGELDYNQLFEILNIVLEKNKELRELVLSKVGGG